MISSNWKDLIASNGVPINGDEMDRLNLYSELLLEWNTKVNLISRKDEHNIWPNHILHSIAVLFEFTIPDGALVADIGSGGGLPGVPLALMLPDVRFIMIESIQKKALALADIVARLSLNNAHVVHGRVERVSSLNDYRGRFDLITARAVAPLEALISWSLPLAKRGSQLLISTSPESRRRTEPMRCPLLMALKGGDLEEEVGNIKGIRYRDLHSVDILFKGIEKTGLVGKKIVTVAL